MLDKLNNFDFIKNLKSNNNEITFDISLTNIKVFINDSGIDFEIKAYFIFKDNQKLLVSKKYFNKEQEIINYFIENTNKLKFISNCINNILDFINNCELIEN